MSIHSLPVELLSRIFLLGAQYDYPYAHSPFLLKPDQDYYAIPSSSFQLLVSHVSTHWRSVALRTSPLWTTLHFRTPAHLDRAEAFLARTSNRLLDILVDTVALQDHTPGVTLCRDEIHSVFRIITPHVLRWRAFHLKIRDNACKAAARHHLSSCGPAPHLDTLQLYHFEDYRTAQNLYLATYRPPVRVFDNGLPNLKNVSLIGVNLPWEQSPYLVNLHTLELALHSDNVRPPYEYWEQMLRGSPEMRRLSLHYSGPRLGTGSWPGKGEKICVAGLKELSLTDLDPDYLCMVMERLILPAVRKVSLDLPDQDFTEFVKMLARKSQSMQQQSHQPTQLRAESPASPSTPSIDFPSDDLTHVAAGSSASQLWSNASSSSSPAGSYASSSASSSSSSSSLSSWSVWPPTPSSEPHLPLPNLPQLTHLIITALECTTTSWLLLLQSLIGLRVLEIDFARVGDGFERVFSEGQESVKDNGLPRKLLLPKLETFCIAGLEGAKVEEIIRARESACPLSCRCKHPRPLDREEDTSEHDDEPGVRCSSCGGIVRTWMVRWSERWRMRDPLMDALVDNGCVVEGGLRVVKVRWVEGEEGEGDDDDDDMDEADGEVLEDEEEDE